MSKKLNILGFSSISLTNNLSPKNTIPSFALPNKVVSTIAQDKILSSLDEVISIPDTLSEINGDVSFAALDQTDKTSIIARKNNGKIEVWKYNQFDGFGHILSSSGDFDPVVVDWYDDFSSFSSLLWEGMDGYNELIVDVEGGVRRFKK